MPSGGLSSTSFRKSTVTSTCRTPTQATNFLFSRSSSIFEIIIEFSRKIFASESHFLLFFWLHYWFISSFGRKSSVRSPSAKQWWCRDHWARSEVGSICLRETFEIRTDWAIYLIERSTARSLLFYDVAPFITSSAFLIFLFIFFSERHISRGVHASARHIGSALLQRQRQNCGCLPWMPIFVPLCSSFGSL